MGWYSAWWVNKMGGEQWVNKMGRYSAWWVNKMGGEQWMNKMGLDSE